MRFIVYGAGAIGGVLGARLAQHGHEVVLIARGPHLEAIQRQGLRLESPDGEETLQIPAVDDPTAIPPEPGDVVVLAVKSQDTAGALDRLAVAAPPDTPVVCAQNGVDNERQALRRFANVYGAYEIFPASHLEPGVVRADSAPVTGIMDIGRYPHGVDDLARELAAVLSEASFDATAVPDVMRWKYAKLLTNLNNVIEVLCEPAARKPVHVRAKAEAVACLAAAGIEAATAEEDAKRRGELFARGASMQMRDGGSTWQSVSRATGSIETDYLNGEIVLLGRLHGVPTPVNATLQRLGNALARDRRPALALSEEELMRKVEAAV